MCSFFIANGCKQIRNRPWSSLGNATTFNARSLDGKGCCLHGRQYWCAEHQAGKDVMNSGFSFHVKGRDDQELGFEFLIAMLT